MKPIALSAPRHPFDYVHLMGLLRKYSAPRDKIGAMIRDGEIIRVKKGLYVVSPEYGGIVDLPVLSGLVFGPSYVSLDFALSHYGMIPERVHEVTCMTTKRNKHFDTPVGRFSYRHLRPSAYALGVRLEKAPPGNYFLATREKALCDKVAHVGVKNRREVGALLFEDLRVDQTVLNELDAEQLLLIARNYGSPSVRHLAGWFRKRRP